MQFVVLDEWKCKLSGKESKKTNCNIKAKGFSMGTTISKVLRWFLLSKCFKSDVYDGSCF